VERCGNSESKQRSLRSPEVTIGAYLLKVGLPQQFPVKLILSIRSMDERLSKTPHLFIGNDRPTLIVLCEGQSVSPSFNRLVTQSDVERDAGLAAGEQAAQP
jgi:hypothetical protein